MKNLAGTLTYVEIIYNDGLTIFKSSSVIFQFKCPGVPTKIICISVSLPVGHRKHKKIVHKKFYFLNWVLISVDQ